MLSLQFIRENKAKVQKAIIDKNIKLDLEYFLDLDEKKKALKIEIDKLRQKRNQITEQIKKGEKKETLLENAKEVKKLLVDITDKYSHVKEEFDKLAWLVPNIPSKDTPVGKDEKDNKVIEEVGKKPKLDFEIRDHIELGRILDILDLERGAKVGGFRGYFLKNEGVLLHLGILWYALLKMKEKGFTPLIPPTLVKDFAFYGTGWFPFDSDNVYRANPAGKLKLDSTKDEGTNLVGTSEVGLCAYYSNEVLKEEILPIRFCGYSQCYRSEIGSYGRDTRGIYRVHEFTKVEQVILCKNDYDESTKQLENLRAISQGILRDLALPHRVIQMCTGEMGAGKYKMYDIETWMPSRKAYGETHSASNLGDWQARRLNIKYKDKEGKTEFVHTLNNTAIASPRILIAILENNQQKDGSVKVPKVLQKWVGKKIIKPK